MKAYPIFQISAGWLILFTLPFSEAVGEINKEWLEGILVKEGNSDVERIESFTMAAADPPGTVFGSNRTRVRMELVLKSGENRKKSVVVIALPSNPLREKQILDSGLFKTDIMVYRDVLPRMNTFLLSKPGIDERRGLWVKALDIEEYSRLVVEDWAAPPEPHLLKNKMNGLDMAHCKVAVDGLAKFHALSSYLQSKNEITVEPFNLSLGQRNKDKIGDWFGRVFKEFAKSIRAAWGEEWENTASAIDRKSINVTKEILTAIERDDSKFNALLIGAANINNMYFSYDAEHSPIGIKFINFQNSFWNSPALDLQAFLNTSPEPKILTDDKLRDEIVDHYWHRLKFYLKSFGSEKSVSHEDLKKELRRTELNGLASALNVLSGLYTSPEDAAYTEKFIIDALKSKKIRIDSKGMILPRFINVAKKLVKRAQRLGVVST